MKSFGSVLHIWNVDQKEVIRALDQCLSTFGFDKKSIFQIPMKGLKGIPHFDRLGKNDILYFVSEKDGNWLTIIEAHLSNKGPGSRDLSLKLSEVLATYILSFALHQDGSVLFYNFDDKGVPRGSYNSFPQYKNKRLSDEMIKQQRHNPDQLKPILPDHVKMLDLQNILDNGWWSAYDNNMLDEYGYIKEEFEPQIQYAFEEDRMVALGNILEICGKNNEYPYDAWEGSTEIPWHDFMAINYAKKKKTFWLFGK